MPRLVTALLPACLLLTLPHFDSSIPIPAPDNFRPVCLVSCSSKEHGRRYQHLAILVWARHQKPPASSCSLLSNPFHDQAATSYSSFHHRPNLYRASTTGWTIKHLQTRWRPSTKVNSRTPRATSVAFELRPAFDDKIHSIAIVTLTPRDDESDFTRIITLVYPSESVIIGRASKTASKGLVGLPENAWFNSPIMSREHAKLFMTSDGAVSPLAIYDQIFYLTEWHSGPYSRLCFNPWDLCWTTTLDT